ncbi:MAG TPA: alkaline phosphatase family protein [Gemmatimonadaceae bacterium]|nr:alkaline phosphatase family protein [Gemmatimonadaceae bacterium]
MRLLACLLCAAGCAQAQPASAPAAPPAPAGQPTLVVLITIDGFRADYLDRFGPQLQGGLGRLKNGGAWFTNGHQDHGITETAPGHASLLSGRFPRSTGIVANVVGVIDEAAPLLGFSGVTGASPRRFQGTALLDWMRAKDPRSRALSVSMKDRGAILPLGTAKQHVYWYPGDGDFTTSKYYMDSLPDWVEQFNARRLPQRYAGKAWTPLLPANAYPEPDSVPVEGGGTDFVFPHMIPADSAQAASVIRITPFIDEVTVAFALEGVRALRLGEGPQTDLLAVSLSGTDLVNHRLGPNSRESHDQVLRVDRQIGVLLDSLFKLRDPSRVIVALSADHGFQPIPELAPANVVPRPERVTLRTVLATVRAQLAAMKVDTAAVQLDLQLLILDREAFRKANVNADSIVTLFRNEALKIPGVARVDRLRDLLRGDTVGDPITRRWSHQIPPKYPVELVITLTPGSIWAGIVATHGSPHDDDSNVPIVFYGPGFAPGRYTDFVRTVDIAPTLARRLGVTPLEKLEGVPLTKALK